ncbi:MAG: rhodanese-like domain-containing protein [Chloroflexi bacterium]|nr:rhodanese-like domain-containing protein [Chloroflexota bacterium]
MADYPNSDLLASAAWLASHLDDPGLRIVDARSAADYAEGHIPGAVVLPERAFRSTGDIPDTCTAEEFAATAGTLGIAQDNTVICYDAAGPMAARAWWAFARYGHADVRFLNGGIRQWQAGGHPVSTDSPAIVAVDYTVSAQDDGLHCSLPQAVDAATHGGVFLWDVRTTDEYTGAVARNSPPDRAGHLPDAVHLEWTELVDVDTGLFKPADEMRAILNTAGITPEAEVVAY